MKLRRNPFLLHSLTIAIALGAASSAHAASGTWNVDADGLWSTDTNWLGNVIANDLNSTANFTNNITADRTVHLDGDRTLNKLVFSDSDTATSGSWILDNNGTSTNNLILSGTTGAATGTAPVIDVGSLGSGKTATISATIEGSYGFTKNGTGTLTLSGNNSALSGTINFSGGTALTNVIVVKKSNALGTGNIVNNAGAGSIRLDNTGTGSDITLTNSFSNLSGSAASAPVLVNVAGNNKFTGSLSVNTGGSHTAVQVDGGTLEISGNWNNVTTTRTVYLQGAGDGIYSGILQFGNNNLTKAGAGTWTLTNANTYTGTTSISGGTLKNGSATTFTNKGALSMSSTGTFDLGGFNASFTNVSASTATNTIINNGSSDATLTISGQANQISALIKNGATHKLAVNIANANSSSGFAPGATQNTFSGGLTLTHNDTGTRLRITSAITTTGSAGAITSSPFGRGAITIGQAATDKAGILLDTVTNIAIANDLVFNTARGTDIEGFRLDTTGHVLSGKITANLADATFATGSTNTGAVTLSGQVIGSQGLALRAVTTGGLTVTLNNAGTANNYTGNTSVGFGSNARNTLVLGRADQIPNGAGKGDVSVIGNFNLGGFNETINGLSGSGSVDGGSGSPTLTLGDGDATGNTFSGVIKNTGGTLNLTKTGNGTQTLSGANTYTGTTTVSAGTLAIDAGGSIANSSQIIVGANATFDVGAVSFTLGGSNSQTLSGTGVIAGDMTIDAQGTLAIGSSPGTMTFANDLGLNLGSVSNFEINGFSPGNYDLALAAVAGSQTVTFNGGTLNLLFQSGFSTNGTVKIFDFDAYAGGGFTTVAATGLASGFTAYFDQTNGIVTVVPEPRAALLGGLGLMILLRRRRVA